MTSQNNYLSFWDILYMNMMAFIHLWFNDAVLATG
jgi:hypothetical protein